MSPATNHYPHPLLASHFNPAAQSERRVHRAGFPKGTPPAVILDPDHPTTALVIKRHHDEINKYRTAILDMLEAKSFVAQQEARGRARGLLEDFCDKPTITEEDIERFRAEYQNVLSATFRETGGCNYGRPWPFEQTTPAEEQALRMMEQP